MDTDTVTQSAPAAPAPVPGSLAANVAAFIHSRAAAPAPVQVGRELTEAEINRAAIVLNMQFKAWKEAELGFVKNLINSYAAGMSKREIAIACGVRPRDVEAMLDAYGPGIREYLNDQPDTEER